MPQPVPHALPFLRALLLLPLFSALPATAATPPEPVAAARAFRAAHELAILDDFRAFLSLPNVADDLDAMARNADWITGYLEARGFAVETVSAGGAPYVLAERRFPGATRTVLIYAHFDGQPVDPSEWSSAPFEPVLRDGLVEAGGRLHAWSELEVPVDPEWRVFARSAGDDKAPVIALAAALDGLEAAGLVPSVNVKLVLDGEEEQGSPTVAAVLERYGDRLDADLMLFCDGPMHQSRRRQLVFGVRGSMTVELTTYGPNRPLHSGHYGNWAPSPTDALVRLLATLHDEQGQVAIEGYRDDVRPPTVAELAAIDAMPTVDDALREDLALGCRYGGETRLERLLLEPAIIVKGLQAGGVGAQASNVIRPDARASLNVRMVPDETPASVRAKLAAHFRRQGFHVVEDAPDDGVLAAHPRVLRMQAPGGYPGYRTAMDGPEAQRLIALLDAIDGRPTLRTPTMGGSLPIHRFDQALDMPIVLLPVANHDNNQHGADENLRIRNLWDAIEIYAAVLGGYGR
jgi:acetylornithine deacetylase/succinyl-diaminopimelate desuccinylase-like protein